MTKYIVHYSTIPDCFECSDDSSVATYKSIFEDYFEALDYVKLLENERFISGQCVNFDIYISDLPDNEVDI